MKTFTNSTLLKGTLVLLFSTLACTSVFSQKTGSLDTNITFSGASRQLSIYVPTDYNATNNYQLMVCLHGLGDNSANYRNVLVNSLNWKTLYPNTIFVCPESNTTTDDYFAPEGSGNEAIITECINYATANYNINTADIILQGFSLGGRAALRFGLLNPSNFKGLLLNTPAIQGIKESSNRSQTSYTFNFSNANKIPVYISHGATDELYTSAIDSTVEQLIINDCPLFFTRIAGMGHNVPSQAQLGNFNKFFDSTATAAYGIEVVKVNLPNRTCDGKVSGTVLVRNTGKTTINSISLELSAPGTTPTLIPFNGLNLASFQHTYLTITNQAIGTSEVLDFTAKATLINNSIATDPFSPNGENTASKSLVSQNTGRALPFIEGFEGSTFPPTGWVLNPSGESYSAWYDDTDIKKTGSTAMGAFNTIRLFDNRYQHDDIQTPLLNLTTLAKPHLTFDMCYNYHKFKVGNDSLSFADTLEILISTDCGATFTSLFRRGGADLATFAEPILNPADIQQGFPSPAANNWNKVFISLDNYATSTAAILNFRYQSDLGGSVTIDNVSVGNNPVGINTPKITNLKVYPNPATNKVYISANDIIAINVFDIGGKQYSLETQQITNEGRTLVTEGLSTGIYYLQIITPNATQTQKLLIER